MSDPKKDTRTLRERMKGRTADLDAAIDGQTAVSGVPSNLDVEAFKQALPDADTVRRKAAQSTDKNNYW